MTNVLWVVYLCFSFGSFLQAATFREYSPMMVQGGLNTCLSESCLNLNCLGLNPTVASPHSRPPSSLFFSPAFFLSTPGNSASRSSSAIGFSTASPFTTESFLPTRSEPVPLLDLDVEGESIRRNFRDFCQILGFPSGEMLLYALPVQRLLNVHKDKCRSAAEKEEFVAEYSVYLKWNDFGSKDDFFMATFLSSVLYRNFHCFSTLIEKFDKFGALKEILASSLITLMKYFFSPRVSLPELRSFLPAFAPHPLGVVSADFFLRHVDSLRHADDYNGIRDHLDYAFSLLDLSKATVNWCCQFSSSRFDVGVLSHLFHAFLRNPSVPDSVVQEGIQQLYTVTNPSRFDFVSIAISASFFRPSCFDGLFRLCLWKGDIEALLPYLDYSQSTVLYRVERSLEAISIDSLVRAIDSAIKANLPFPQLLLFLSKKMPIEDYLIPLIGTDKLDPVLQSLDLVRDRIDLMYIASQLRLDQSSLADFLTTCSQSTLFFPLPVSFLPILAAKEPQVIAKEISPEAYQIRVIASVMTGTPLNIKDPRSYWQHVSLVAYSGTDVRSLVEFLKESHDYEVLARIAQYFLIESTCSLLTFEDVQERKIRLEIIDYMIPCLRITFKHDENLIILI